MSEVPGISFTEYQSEFLKLRAHEQDLKSALYAIHPYPDSESPTHFILIFPQLEDGDIDYSVLDSNMMELRLLNQLPKLVLLRLAELYRQVLDWSEGKASYPHSFYQPEQMNPAPSTLGDEFLPELDVRNDAASKIIEDALSKIAPATPPTPE